MMLEPLAGAVEALRLKNAELIREQQRRYGTSVQREHRRVEKARMLMAEKERLSQRRLEKLARDRSVFSQRQNAKTAALVRRFEEASEARRREREKV
jgi:hypothetical protein